MCVCVCVWVQRTWAHAGGCSGGPRPLDIASGDFSAATRQLRAFPAGCLLCADCLLTDPFECEVPVPGLVLAPDLAEHDRMFGMKSASSSIAPC